MDEQSQPAPSVWPISFALGLALVLLGLIVSPLVIAPVGAAIAVLAGSLWVRGANSRSRRERAAAPSPEPLEESDAERFPRSRLLERATLGLGGPVALGSLYPRSALRCCRRSSASGGRPSTSGRWTRSRWVSTSSRRSSRTRNRARSRAAPPTSATTALGESAEFHDHVEPLHARRLPHAAERAAVSASATGGEDERWRGGARPGTGRRLRLPVSRQPVRRRGQPNGGPGAAWVRPLRVLDPQRPLWLGDLYSVGRVEGTGARARIAAFKLRRRRPAGHRPRVVPLPDQSAVVTAASSTSTQPTRHKGVLT